MGSCNDSSPKGSFEIRSTNLPLVALKLKSTDLSRLGQDFSRRFGEMPGFFDDDGIVIDLSHFDGATGNEATRGLETPLDFSALGSMLREHGLRSVAVRGGNARQVAAAVAAGFFSHAHAVATKIFCFNPLGPLRSSAPCIGTASFNGRTGDRQTGSMRAAGLRAWTRPGCHGHGQRRSRVDRRWPHTRLRTLAREGICGRDRQHHRACLRHVHGFTNDRHCLNLRHRRSPCA